MHINLDTMRPGKLYALVLAGLSLVSVGFYAVGALQAGTTQDWYMVWNLFLAWVPLGLAYWLVRVIRRHSWSSWPAIGLSLAWLAFLPNSFYMVSDLIHLQDMPRSYLLFDSIMFAMFIITALAVGCTSLYLVHTELRRRLMRRHATFVVATIIFLCSFAIYLGRDLRWNSWDVLVNPAGILFDISERVIDPLAHPLAFSVTAMFFVFLSSVYWSAWLMMRAIRRR